MVEITLSDQEQDKWVPNMGKGIFKPSLVYKMHFTSLATHPHQLGYGRASVLLNINFLLGCSYMIV
jgi:hypothetical protein